MAGFEDIEITEQDAVVVPNCQQEMAVDPIRDGEIRSFDTISLELGSECLAQIQKFLAHPPVRRLALIQKDPVQRRLAERHVPPDFAVARFVRQPRPRYTMASSRPPRRSKSSFNLDKKTHC